MTEVFERKIWQVFLGAIPRSLHGGAERIVRMGLKSMNDFKMTFAGVASSLRMTEQPRVSLLRSAPAAHQVVANYTRGYLLFGLFGSLPAFFLPRLMWYSYPARSIITPETAKIPRDVRRTQRRTDLEVKFDEDFEEIVHACLEGRDLWVWLTPELIEVYREVHRLGFAATVGVYRDGKLVAGLWGISVGRVFGIMSAFHRENGAGSLAIGALVESVADDGRWSIVDNGVVSKNYARFGAFEVPTERFCELIWQTLR